MRHQAFTLAAVVVASAGVVCAVALSGGESARTDVAVAAAGAGLLQLAAVLVVLGRRSAPSVATRVPPDPALDADVVLGAQRRTLQVLDVAQVAHQANNQLLALRFKLASLARADDVERPALVAEIEEVGAELERLVACLPTQERMPGADEPVPVVDLVRRAVARASGRRASACAA